MSGKKKLVRLGLGILLSLCILGITSVVVINALVKLWTEDQIITSQQAAELENVDCILVLGCGVRDDGSPSAMLRDRLKRSVELYELGVSPKLLMTGDHGQEGYDEVSTMKQFAVDGGIASEDVFMDHAGFSTYESIYRAKEIFQAKKVLIISQEYHLYRAIYIANQLGLEAYGVSSDYRNYSGQTMRDFREVLARVKDCGTCIIQPEPTYLGEVIPVSGDGNVTNDGKTDFAA